MIIAGIDTGYDTCQGGAVRRRFAVDCPQVARPNGGACPVHNANSTCSSDKDCTHGYLGYCNLDNGGNNGCSCWNGCIRDSDCTGTDEVCECGDPMGQCVVARCHSGAGCQPGCDCVDAPSSSEFVCQTPGDNCILDSDCVGTHVPDGGASQFGSSCGYTGKVLCIGVDFTGGPPQGLQCRPQVYCTPLPGG